jgi:hypothetical protein
MHGPYPGELRMRVIAFVEEGGFRRETAEQFEVGPAICGNMQKREFRSRFTEPRLGSSSLQLRCRSTAPPRAGGRACCCQCLSGRSLPSDQMLCQAESKCDSRQSRVGEA